MNGGSNISSTNSRRMSDAVWGEFISRVLPGIDVPHTPDNDTLLRKDLRSRGPHRFESLREIIDQFRPLRQGGQDLFNGQTERVVENALKVLESGSKRDGHDWHVRAELTVDILKEMRKTKAGREQMHNLLADMATFSGRVDVLREFLEYSGRKLNPYEAAKGLVIEVIHDDKQARSYQTTSEPGASQSRPVALGNFGQPIVSGKHYLLYDPSDPSRKFAAKDDITVSTLIHFNPNLRQSIEHTTPKNVAAEATQRVGDHPTRLPKSHTLRELFGDLYDKLKIDRFEELGGETLSSDAGYRRLSTREQRLIAIFQELQELKAKLETDVFKQLGASKVLYLGEDKRLIEADPGGGLLHWYAKSIESGRELPELVRVAYEAITDRAVAGSLSKAQRDTYYDYLRGWRTMHDYTDSQTSLSPARQDYRTFQALRKLAKKGALAEDHPMLTGEFNLDAQVVNSGLLTATGDLTFQERGRITADSGLRALRSAVNAYALEQFETEFFKSLDRFAPLFKIVVSEGDSQVTRWRDDCSGQSLPLTRLRQSLLGANIIKDGSRTTSLLNATEFREIEDATRLWDICRGDAADFCGALSMKRFQQMVTSVIVSARKFDALEYAIADGIAAGKPILPPGSTLEQVGDISKVSRIEIPTGRYLKRQHLVPCEELRFPQNYEGEPKVMLQDFVRRALSGAQSGVLAGMSDRAIKQLQVLGRVGLVDRAEIGGIERALPKVVDLVPVGDTWREDIEVAGRAVNHPLLIVSKFLTHRVTECQIQLAREVAGPWHQAGYLNPSQCELLGEICEIAADPAIVRAGIDLRGPVLEKEEQNRLAELVRVARSLEHHLVFEPYSTREPDIIMLQAHRIDLERFGRKRDSADVQYFDRAVLEDQCEDVALHYYRWQSENDRDMPRALRENLGKIYLNDPEDPKLLRLLRSIVRFGSLVRIPEES